ncbi:hypothetical protein QFC22_000736 [Naganishia vaughanmartiniae]|uniref:Uncharacterized protein n=1 Tax=Naganishia vaughanmartiniae TaxID=1424756 RepID=A0ACC2XKN6_9TREE|nr:hypothetical protein QFC22_000736 [Naganishia vaughanmartiniae]
MAPTTDEMDTDSTSTLAQVAADTVQDLVETAAQVLGTPQLDDSSLGKLAQMSKELELELEMHSADEGGVLVQHSEAGDDHEEQEEEVHDTISNHYVTAPSSPIIHVSTFTSITATTITTDVSTATTTRTPTTPVLSRRGSKDVHQHSIGRKLRFTTITGQSTQDAGHLASGRKTASLDVQFDEGHYVASDPGTPNISETANQIRRTLSLASVDSLLRVAQDQETRDQFLDNVKEHGKRMVWRDERERRKLPGDAERALVLAVKRGLSESFYIEKAREKEGSFILAFAVRAGVNLLLTLIRTLRKGYVAVLFLRIRLRWLLIRHAIFGAESFRFGGMIGTFTLLNTLTLHLLRLAPPSSYIKKRLRRVLQQDRSPLTYGPPERWNGRVDVESGEYTMEEEDTGERRWQAAVAGAVGSLGLLWEQKERRVGVAQQYVLFSYLATYNAYSRRTGFEIPYGDILVFGLSCGQIMFAFLLSPETIPPEYNTWIQAASQVEGDAVKLNRMIERQRKVDPGLIMKIMQHKNITPHNKRELTHVLEQAKLGLIPEGVPCAAIHPWLDSCRTVQLERYFTAFRFMLPVYSALHFIPMLVLRRKSFVKNPLKMLGKAFVGTFRSSSFLAVFILIYQGLLCLRTQTLEGNTVGALPEKMQALLKRKENFWLIGFATCFSLFAEEKKRRAELAMYVLPRGLEAAWSSARKRAWVPIVPFGETILGMAAMAMVMDAYKMPPSSLRQRKRSNTPPTRSTGVFTFILAAAAAASPAQAFYFQWSSTSYQCYTQTLSWVGGTPPFRAVIAPILQMPFIYDIPSSAFVDGKGSYDITVQLSSGLSYMIMMGDATGMGTGGSSGRITVQGYAESGCLSLSNRNQTTLDVSFMVAAKNIQQCKTSYNMTWDITPAAVPPQPALSASSLGYRYNMTVISLDQSFNPFDVPFGPGNTSAYDWEVSVAAGKQFTVMMNDGKGYGYGGVGGAYTVNRTSAGNTQCDFVGGSTTTAVVPSSTASGSSTTSDPASTSDPAAGGSGSESGNGPPKGTVIAGASIGALVGIGLSAAVAFLIFFYRRRRRNRRRTQEHSSNSNGRGKDNGGDAGSVVMADGRRRPADAMSVNLFDDDGEYYQDPNDGHYVPIPYDGGSYSGSPVTPGSTLASHPQTRTETATPTPTRNGMSNSNESPLGTSAGENPFESGRELHGEEAKAALFALGRAGGGGRSWSGASGDTFQSHTNTMTGGAGGVGSLHRLDTFADSRGPLPSATTPHSGGDDAWGDSVPPPLGAAQLTKSEEALADADAVDLDEPTRNRYASDTSYSPAASSPLLSPPPTSGPGTGGGFRITNVSDADPLLPPPRSQTSSSITGTNASSTPASSYGRRPRGEPRFVRHADAGRAPQREEEVIDLPPLYTDLVREDDPPPPVPDHDGR